MGRGVANQIVNSVPGHASWSRSSTARSTRRAARLPRGRRRRVPSPSTTRRGARARRCAAGVPAVTDDPIAAVRGRRHRRRRRSHRRGRVRRAASRSRRSSTASTSCSMNAELDGTVGPLLQALRRRGRRRLHRLRRRPAGRADEPLPVRPGDRAHAAGAAATSRACRTRTATRPRRRASPSKWGQNPYMVTSFADGTKISLRAGHRRQRHRHDGRAARHGAAPTTRGHVDELTRRYDVDELRALGGVVDYVVGAKPGPGVFVLGHARRPEAAALPQPLQARRGSALQLLHALPPVPLRGADSSVARAVLFGDAAIAADRRPRRSTSSRPPRPTCRPGTISTRSAATTPTARPRRADVTAAESAAADGRGRGLRAPRDVRKDEVLTYDDVRLPAGRLVDELRAEQARLS